MKQGVAPVLSGAVPRRGPRAVQRGPDKSGWSAPEGRVIRLERARGARLERARGARLERENAQLPRVMAVSWSARMLSCHAWP
jgi:hypothetical protein